MSKKQEKSVENVNKEATCQNCKVRMSGAKAKRECKSGYCSSLKAFVNRKHETCDGFKAK